MPANSATLAEHLPANHFRPAMKTMLPYLFALGTALCWGMYGPTLAQSRVQGVSAFKPYVGIGTAYLFIAIGGGILAMAIMGDSFTFTDKTSKWGFAAGTLGALGAFFLTLAMFSGGHHHPHTVMPFVFGGAVTVTAVFTIIASGISISQIFERWPLWVGIIGMGVSAVVVAYNTPHGSKPKPKDEVHASAPADVVTASATSKSE